MKTIILHSLLLTGCLTLALPAQARPHRYHSAGADHSGTFQNSRGGTGTFNQTESREAGQTTGMTTRTNASGTYTHSFNNNWDRSTGTGTHHASTIYADGQTSSSQGSITKTAPDDYTYTGTHTGVNGNTTDVQKTSSFNPTTDTRTVDSTYTNPVTDKSATVDKSISFDPSAGTKTVDATATGANGKTASSDQTFTKTNDGYTKDGTVTGPNGKTATDQSIVTYTKDANGQTTRVQSSEVTGPNGKEHTGSNTETYSTTPVPAPTTPPQD